MRPLVCFIATSLDGYIAGPAGEIDWLFTDQDYGYTQFFANVDTSSWAEDVRPVPHVR